VRYYPGKQQAGKWLDWPGNKLASELIFDAYCGRSFDGLSVTFGGSHCPLSTPRNRNPQRCNARLFTPGR